VLQWNKFLLRIILLFIFLCFLSTHVFSQKNLGILIEGPKEIWGIDIMGPNAVHAYKAEYEVNGVIITVVFTRHELILNPELILPSECNLLKTFNYAVEVEQGTQLLIYNEPAKYSFLFYFPQNMGEFCNFLQKFIDRFIYFLVINTDESDAPFPAIVDY
jgi:hypothetical protein